MAFKVQQHPRNNPSEEGGATAAPKLAGLCEEASPTTLSLFHAADLSSFHVDLNERSPLPSGWQKFLDIKTGEIYYKKKGFAASAAVKMSRNQRNSELDLKLNLSPPRNPQRRESPPPTSPQSSCVSTELNMGTEADASQAVLRSDSPEATSMVLAGCPCCLMYVMLSDEEEPKCPKCKSSVLLDFQGHHTITKNIDNNNKKKMKKN